MEISASQSNFSLPKNRSRNSAYKVAFLLSLQLILHKYVHMIPRKSKIMLAFKNHCIYAKLGIQVRAMQSTGDLCYYIQLLYLWRYPIPHDSTDYQYPCIDIIHSTSSRAGSTGNTNYGFCRNTPGITTRRSKQYVSTRALKILIVVLNHWYLSVLQSLCMS